MIKKPDAAKDDSGASPQRQMFRSGTLLIIGIGIFLIVGWIFYRQTLPAAWLHDFSEAIAQHAMPDPNPREPEDIRQASPRTHPDSPYICANNVIDMNWERLFVVTSRQALEVHSFLSTAEWSKRPLTYFTELLDRDDRYQLLVLVNGKQVLDAQLYFTFWGDLSALERPEGFARMDAIFEAQSLEERYVVSPATDVPPEVCA